MRGLSNIFGRREGFNGPAVCRLARAEETGAALRVMLGIDGHPAGDATVAEFMRYADERGLDLGGMWVADAGGRVVWAVFPVASPGRTALLFMPRAIVAGIAPAAEALIDAVCQWQGGRGTRLAQALLDPESDSVRRVCEGRGFRFIAELVYLQANVPTSPPATELPAGIRWETYSKANHGLFREAILGSYEESLDCPGISGWREIEDVMAGHKAAGAFDPGLWLALVEGDRPIGALLLAVTSPRAMVELVYVGLAPAARGRGLGDAAMRMAMALSASVGAETLTLAMDGQNRPAMRLYHRHGMRRLCAKVAMMRRLSGNGDISIGARGSDNDGAAR